MAGTVLVRFLGESSSLERAAVKSEVAIAEVEKSSKGAALQLAGLGRDAANKVVPGFSGISGSASKLGTALAGPAGVAAGAAVAGIAIAELVGHGVKDFLALTDAVRGIQRVTGATAEDASKLNAVFHRTGVDAQAGATGLFMLSKNIEHHAAKLQADGVEIVRNKTGQVDLTATLTNVADAYQRAGKGVEGNNIAADAFGRTGKTLLPILGKTKDEINGIVDAANRHHMIVSQDDVDKGLELKVAMKDLGDAFKGLEIELAKGVIPALTDTAHGVTWLVEKFDDLAVSVKGAVGATDDQERAMETWAKGAQKAAAKTVDWTDESKELTKAHVAEEKALDKLEGRVVGTASSLGDMADAQKAATKEEADAKTKVDELAKALWDAQIALDAVSKKATPDELAAGALSIERGYIGVADAATNVATAEKALADARAHGGEAEIAAAEDKVSAARREHRTATEHLADAVKGVVAARAALAKLEAGPTADQQAKAQERITAALRVRDKAEQGVADALHKVETANHAVEDSERSRADATFNSETATLDVAKAQRELDEARATQDPNRIATAQDNLRNALHNQADAADDVRKANEGVADAHHGVDDATRAVADAQQAVADAERDVTAARKEQAALQIIDPADLAAAQDTLTHAIRDQRSAQADLNQSNHDVRDSEKELADLRAHAHDDAVTAATLALRDARLAQRDAVLSENDAQQRQNDLERQGTSADPAVIQATHDKEAALRDLAAAHDVLSWDAAAAAGNVANLQAKLVALANASPGLVDQINRILVGLGHAPVTGGQLLDPKPGEHLNDQRIKSASKEGPPIVVHVSGIVGDEKAVVEKIRQGLVQVARNVGTSNLFA